MDWMLLETLAAVGAPPVGAAQLSDFDEWVRNARPAGRTVEVGLRSQPNLELLSQLAPDRILMTPRFAALKANLTRIAPVSVIPAYSSPGPLWSHLLAATREVARLAGQPAAGRQLIQTTQGRIADARGRLPGDTGPLLILQFVDAQHVRVFGEGSLFAAVLKRLGLDNAWRGGTNAWGYALVGLDALMQRRARIVVVEPLPYGLESQLASSGLWAHVPAARQGQVLRMPGAWSFGGLPSAAGFAEQLVQTLNEPGVRRFRPDRFDGER